MQGLPKISCFYRLLFLRYLQSLNLTPQIPNFHTKLDKIELLITLDREMISTWSFHRLIIIRRGNYLRQYFDWWRYNSKLYGKIVIIIIILIIIIMIVIIITIIMIITNNQIYCFQHISIQRYGPPSKMTHPPQVLEVFP